MNSIKNRIIGLIFCSVFINILNAHAQINNQPPPPYDPGYITPLPDSMKTYIKVDTMPRFPGSIDKYFRDNIRYPQEAVEKKIQGTVFVSFIIEKDGSISNVKLLRSYYPVLTSEAIRLVSTMPKWIPGKQNGKAVRVQWIVPIHFKLPPASGSKMKQ